jgi:NADH:ubiquinone oxidoreductase subunit 3 (subunit A)
MRSTDYSDSAYRLVIEPHVAVAIWAVIAALACVLVMIVAEMIKNHAAATRDHPRPKKLGRRR